MDKDYSEIFCNAVDTIVQKRLENMHFDITKICTIKKIVNKRAGQYLVSDGASDFMAYGAVGYSIGEEIYTLVPKNDYKVNSLILGLYNKVDNNNIELISVSDKIELKYSKQKLVIPANKAGIEVIIEKVPKIQTDDIVQIIISGYTKVNKQFELSCKLLNNDNITIKEEIKLDELTAYNQVTPFSFQFDGSSLNSLDTFKLNLNTKNNYRFPFYITEIQILVGKKIEGNADLISKINELEKRLSALEEKLGEGGET